MTLTTRFTSDTQSQTADTLDFSFLKDTRPAQRQREITWKKATGMNNKG